MIYKTTVTFQKLFHYAVGMVRQESGSTSMGFLKAIFETLFMFFSMMLIMLLIRGFGVQIRGEFGFYILSGVSLFLMHNKVIGALLDKKGNDPMLAILSISRGMMIVGSIIHVVYMQFIITALLFMALVIYYGNIPVFNWNMLIFCYLINILWSVSLGSLFLALSPLSEYVITKISMVYRRVGMVTSGKMIPGNLLGLMGKFKGLFLINPLFHLIDQTRGALFQHYVPFVSNIYYPIQMSAAVFIVSSIIYFSLKNR